MHSLFCLHIYCPILNVVKWNPQTALINNAAPHNCIFMTTSAAIHSIRHDLQRGRGVVGGWGVRRQQQNNYPSSFTRPLTQPYIMVLSKSNTATENCSVRRSMTDYSSCCGLSTAHHKQCPVLQQQSQYRWLLYYSSPYSYHIKVWVIVSPC